MSYAPAPPVPTKAHRALSCVATFGAASVAQLHLLNFHDEVNFLRQHRFVDVMDTEIGTVAFLRNRGRVALGWTPTSHVVSPAAAACRSYMIHVLLEVRRPDQPFKIVRSGRANYVVITDANPDDEATTTLYTGAPRGFDSTSLRRLMERVHRGQSKKLYDGDNGWVRRAMATRHPGLPPLDRVVVCSADRRNTRQWPFSVYDHLFYRHVPVPHA